MSRLITMAIIALLLLTGTTHAQIEKTPITRKTNSVYFEAFGNGIVYSINFDKLIYQHNEDFFSMRYGLNYLPEIKDYSDYKVYGLILEPNYLIDLGRDNFFEIGMSISLFRLLNDYYPSTLVLFSPRLGVRYQPHNKGNFFRIGLTPIVPLHADEALDNFHAAHMAYLGIGLGITY
jgi:hypothetical protein